MQKIQTKKNKDNPFHDSILNKNAILAKLLKYKKAKIFVYKKRASIFFVINQKENENVNKNIKKGFEFANYTISNI